MVILVLLNLFYSFGDVNGPKSLKRIIVTILESGHIILKIDLAKRLNFYFENLCLWFIDLIESLPIGLIVVRDSKKFRGSLAIQLILFDILWGF